MDIPEKQHQAPGRAERGTWAPLIWDSAARTFEGLTLDPSGSHLTDKETSTQELNSRFGSHNHKVAGPGWEIQQLIGPPTLLRHRSPCRSLSVPTAGSPGHYGAEGPYDLHEFMQPAGSGVGTPAGLENCFHAAPLHSGEQGRSQGPLCLLSSGPSARRPSHHQSAMTGQ